MENDSRFYRIVYEYYEARILFGVCALGEKLPSIPKICAVFGMAPATVRTALKLLEKNGYIQVDARKAAQVIYDASPTRAREYAARYFVPRKEGIMDLTQSGLLLFEPFWEEGMRRWSSASWERFTKELTKNGPAIVSMPVKFYIFVLSMLDNRLILNLYWEMIRYIRFPYLGEAEACAADFGELASASQEQVIAYFRGQFEESYGQAVGTLFAFTEQSIREYHLDAREQIPFRWNIYRQRPQLRYTLVSRILREIASGRWPAGSYLLSLPNMVERYNVSLNTVRRALEILNNLGVVRSQHGKGTMVLKAPFGVDFSKPETKKGARLYRESIQMLALTIRRVALFTLEHVGEAQRMDLARDCRALLAQEKSYLGCEIFLSFIETQCPLGMVRECYGKLREFLAWGYPFKLLRLREQSLNEEYRELMTQMARMLENGENEAAADGWGLFLEREERRFDEMVLGKMKER